MRDAADPSILSSIDLNLLQECLDQILQNRGIPRASQQGDAIAKALIAAFQGGANDKDALIRLADLPEPDMTV